MMWVITRSMISKVIWEDRKVTYLTPEYVLAAAGLLTPKVSYGLLWRHRERSSMFKANMRLLTLLPKMVKPFNMIFKVVPTSQTIVTRITKLKVTSHSVGILIVITKMNSTVIAVRSTWTCQV